MQVLEIWKILLDPDTMEGAVEKNRFLDLFYEGCIGTLTETHAESALPKVPLLGKMLPQTFVCQYGWSLCCGPTCGIDFTDMPKCTGREVKAACLG